MARTEIIRVRATPGEKLRIKERAGEQGISEYLRELGLSGGSSARPGQNNAVSPRPSAGLEDAAEDPQERERFIQWRTSEMVGEGLSLGRAREKAAGEWESGCKTVRI